MLKRIFDVQGIGLLHEANGKQHGLHKATLIYSENGRGKSTLASVFLSLSLGDASLIDDRRTIDGAYPPKVVLQFEDGHSVTFDSGAWSEARPEFLVFGSHFIENNVCSGNIISTSHRKNLLEFALGEAAVKARAELEQHTNTVSALNAEISKLSDDISLNYSGIDYNGFRKLQRIDNVDDSIEAIKKQISAAESIQDIFKKAVPRFLVEPQLNIDAIFEGLSTSLENIHKDTEHVVKAHLTRLRNKDAENWLSQGQEFYKGEFCPYCGQNVCSNDLIHAYQSHFNKLYNDLKMKVVKMSEYIIAATNLDIFEKLSREIELVLMQLENWSEYVHLSQITYNIEPAREALLELRELISNLLQKKASSPAEAVGTEIEKRRAILLWQKVLGLFKDINSSINVAVQSIDDYKKSLSSVDISSLKRELNKLQITKRRYEENVIKMIEKEQYLQSALKGAKNNKKITKEKLDVIMGGTLKKYEKSINNLLNKFGASFSIKDMGGNHRGSGPRSDYKLQLRGKDVALERGVPSFSTTLSDGDKRTLAFAFFVASAFENEDLENKIIVIDDPMCSLDLHRKNHTKVILGELYSKAKQIIILAHDIYFIRDLRDFIQIKDETLRPSVFQLVRHCDDYTNFGQINLDKECETDYHRHHRVLREFVKNNFGEKEFVVNAIRPFLEGYLHRRFPGLIPTDYMFGKILNSIATAEVTNPLYHAKNLVDELKEINGYAKKFHHNDDPNADRSQIINSELVKYAKRALDIVYKGTVESI